MPEPKPKVKPKPVVAAAATTPKPAAKTGAPAKAAVEGAPAPQEAASPEDGQINALAAETAEAAMAEEPPLSRREKRRLRRQHGQDPFLPWLR
jgi:hypothetical protein